MAGSPVGATTPLKCELQDIALADGAVWVACNAAPLLRIDPETGKITRRIDLAWADGRIPGSGHEVVVAFGRLWLANPVLTDDPGVGGRSLLGGIGAVDPRSNRIVRTRVFEDRTPTHVGVGDSHVWFATGATLTRLDPETFRETTVRVGGGAGGVSAAAGSVWTTVRVDDGPTSVVRVDEGSALVTSRFLSDRHPSDVLAEGNLVWVIIDRARTLARLDARTGSIVASSKLPSPGYELAVGAGSVWVSDFHGGLLYRADPASLRITDRLEVGEHPNSFAFGDRVLWLTNYATQILRRIEL